MREGKCKTYSSQITNIQNTQIIAYVSVRKDKKHSKQMSKRLGKSLYEKEYLNNI